MKITVLFKDGVPKGILKGTLKGTLQDTTVRTWWTSTQEIEVSEEDYNSGKITVSSIKSYIKD